MTDGWNMTGGKVYVAPVGADPKDPSRWHQMGVLTEFAADHQEERGFHGVDMRRTISGPLEYTLTTQGPITLFKPEPVKKPEPILRGVFKCDTKTFTPEVLKLYYGTDIKPAGVTNNRGGARKEEKHMGVRKFKSAHGEAAALHVESDMVDYTADSAGVYMKMVDGGFGWFEKADVPLIAHALFEKSGWPDAVKDSVNDWSVRASNGEECWAFRPDSDAGADELLAQAIANLAAYNAWVEGEADRKAKEAEAAKAAAEEEARRKREHDELRTSAIALEALALYNDYYAANSGTPYASWDAVNYGKGADDSGVRYWIAKAEAARAAKPAPKIGDRVRVSADAMTTMGGSVNFDGEAEGVVRAVGTNIDVMSESQGFCQFVDPKYVTVLATAEEVEAEKAKAERDAEIAALVKATGFTHYTAVRLYDRGIRATA